MDGWDGMGLVHVSVCYAVCTYMRGVWRVYQVGMWLGISSAGDG